MAEAHTETAFKSRFLSEFIMAWRARANARPYHFDARRDYEIFHESFRSSVEVMSYEYPWKEVLAQREMSTEIRILVQLSSFSCRRREL
jgi:hypothetical protein